MNHNLKYICDTCHKEISGWPLRRSNMPLYQWCSADCLIEYQNKIDELEKESL